jgi:excisionase family DNA binding protein
MQWYTVPEAARLLSISTRTVWRMLQRGELKFRRCGRIVRIPGSELEPPTDIIPLRRTA